MDQPKPFPAATSRPDDEGRQHVRPAPGGVNPLRKDDPEHLGEYRVVGRMGADARGTFYLGESPAGVEVALRVPTAAWLADPRNRVGVARTLVAARRASGLTGTARILTADLDASVPYMAYEYTGSSAPLRVAVESRGVLGVGDLERLALQTLATLETFHSLGLEHGNVNPDTVLMTDDRVLLVDIGFGLVVGDDPLETWRFAAPEQLRGERGGPSADLFSWACVLAFATTGRPPFHGLARDAVNLLGAGGDVDLSALPSPLRDVAQACLETEPRRRPTAGDALKKLNAPPSSGISGVIPRPVLTSMARPPATGGAERRSPGSAGIWASAGGAATPDVVSPAVAGGPSSDAAVDRLSWPPRPKDLVIALIVMGIVSSVGGLIVAVLVIFPWP